jgi:hypothetical protein
MLDDVGFAEQDPIQFTSKGLHPTQSLRSGQSGLKFAGSHEGEFE